MFYYHYPIIGREIRLAVSIGMHDCQPYTRRGTEYGYPQLFYTTEGSGVLRVDSAETEIQPGMGFFIPDFIRVSLCSSLACLCGFARH